MSYTAPLFPLYFLLFPAHRSKTVIMAVAHRHITHLILIQIHERSINIPPNVSWIPVCATRYALHCDRKHTVSSKLAWIGTDQARRSNSIVLYVVKREYLYLVCSFKKTAVPQTQSEQICQSSPNYLFR